MSTDDTVAYFTKPLSAMNHKKVLHRLYVNRKKCKFLLLQGKNLAVTASTLNGFDFSE